MADAIIIQIADAVAAELNGAAEGTFALGFTAARSYGPRVDLEDLADVRVSVVPRAARSAWADRHSDRREYDIDIGIQRQAATTAALDELMQLVEQIDGYLRRRDLAGFEDARWAAAVNEPVWVPEHREELEQFTSVLTLTYRIP